MSIYTINSEPETAAVADADEMIIYDASASATQKVGVDTLRAYVASGVVNVAATPLAVTQAAHGGRVVTLNKADGIAATLPAATGSGARFHFIVGTTITSSAITIKVDAAAATMTGLAIVANDTDDSVSGFEAGATADTVTLNGTTTGGIKGDSVELIDIAANLWHVRVVSSATGSEATPFSATVS